jgi:two-component system chemotaxis response regulator CheB
LAKRDLIVIGASAGGIGALRLVIGALPRDFSASVVVVLHLAPFSASRLPEILARDGTLPAANAVDGASLAPGQILVAPPDHHVLVREGGRVSVTRGPRANGVRPAIDVLFRSAAREYGPRAVGVVLTGTLDDGAAGLASIRRRGGVAVVQDPDDAEFPDMPRAALALAGADHVLPATELPALLARLVREDVEEVPMKRRGRGGNGRGGEGRQVAGERAPIAAGDGPTNGRPSGFSCPECGGVLWEIMDASPERVECRVGHSYSLESLLADEGAAVEDALWSALRALEEQASLARRLEARARERGQRQSEARFGEQRAAAEARSAVLRTALEQAERAAPPSEAAAEEDDRAR